MLPHAYTLLFINKLTLPFKMQKCYEKSDWVSLECEPRPMIDKQARKHAEEKISMAAATRFRRQQRQRLDDGSDDKGSM